MEALDRDIEKIAGHLAGKQGGFDEVMRLSRDIIREAGQTITLLHNDDSKGALGRMRLMEKQVKELRKIDGSFRYNSQQAYQEYTEACIFFYIKKNSVILSLADMDVDSEAYLMGLMDVVGELKREVLEALHKEQLKRAEAQYELMKRIYDSTRRLRFAEAVLPGFRKKQDVARIQMENAGSDILSYRNSTRAGKGR
jgi:translin